MKSMMRAVRHRRAVPSPSLAGRTLAEAGWTRVRRSKPFPVQRSIPASDRGCTHRSSPCPAGWIAGRGLPDAGGVPIPHPPERLSHRPSHRLSRRPPHRPPYRPSRRPPHRPSCRPSHRLSRRPPHRPSRRSPPRAPPARSSGSPCTGTARRRVHRAPPARRAAAGVRGGCSPPSACPACRSRTAARRVRGTPVAAGSGRRSRPALRRW